MEKLGDKELFSKLKNDDEKAFEVLFHRYYSSMCLFACQFIEDEEKAEEVVQDMFVKIWSKREQLFIDSSFKQYLFRSIKNQCLNQLQHLKIRQKYAQKVKEDATYEPHTSGFLMEFGLNEKIEDSINSLPTRRREIFKMSREEGLKYKEIAEQLNISVKTVEAQMGLALKQLRVLLKDYQDYLLGLMMFLKVKRIK